ncbi:MAG: molybdenum cofactor guanylyltransferase, partial [Pseudomonadota bacterium]
NEPAPFSSYGLPTVADDRRGHGPLAGIAAGLRATDADWVIVVAGDMPHLCGPIVDVLMGAVGTDVRLVVPDLEPGLEPLHAMYHRSAADVIEQRLDAGLRKAMDLVDVLPARRIGRSQLIAVDPALSFRANLNSPADLVEG